MNKEHLSNIEKLVSDYCAKHNLIPAKQELHISISFEPSKQVIANFEEYQLSEIDPKVLESEIMDCDSTELFGKYLESIGHPKTSASRILHCIPHVIGKISPTIRDVVYHGTNDCVNVAWLKHRGIGKESLRLIDTWLASLGLKRLGTPPH